MRRTILALPILVLAVPPLALLGCRPGVDLALSQKFQAAQQAFDDDASEDDFRKVAALYQEILDAEGKCYAVFYNQGNAWMRAGSRGRAIAAYRQAQPFRPADPYLQANLRSALAADDIAPGRPLVEHLLFWQNWMSYPAKFSLTAAVAGVTFLLGVAALFFARRALWRLAVAGLVATALFAVSAGYDWRRFDHLVHGVIVDDEAIARKGNAASYQAAFTEPLSEGTEFRVLESRDHWLLIRLPAGQEGWIETKAAVTY